MCNEVDEVDAIDEIDEDLCAALRARERQTLSKKKRRGNPGSLVPKTSAL